MNLMAAALALTCQMSSISSPDMYKARIMGPTAENQYEMTLTYSYYGLSLDYRFELEKQGRQLVGTSEKGKAMIVKNIQKRGDGSYSLLLDSEAEGRIPMSCKGETTASFFVSEPAFR